MLSPRRRRGRQGNRTRVHADPALAAARAGAGAARVESLEPRTLLAGAEMLKDVDPARLAPATPRELTDVNGTVYFTSGSKLWCSDGTADGTFKIGDTGYGLSELTNLNGTLHFTTNGALWRSDGTEPGTVRVSTSAPGPRDLMAAGTRLFFRGSDAAGEELWTSDGTDSGTHRVKDIRPGGAGADVRGITNVNGRIFFSADDGTSGDELWTSDGTEAGTYRVKDIAPGAGGSGPGYLTNMNGTLYFAATDGAGGFELWKSDGTAAGTIRVKDIRPGSGGSTPVMLQSVNGTLMFLANDGASGFEIWKSDGTETGTTLVRDIIPGPRGAQINYLASAGGLLYFTANDGTSGYELWKSDGTAAGTGRVKDAAPGATSSYPVMLTPFGDGLFYLANNGVTGLEPWISDGTEAGTHLVQDVWAGGSAAGLHGAVQSGNRMFYIGHDSLFVSDGTDAGSYLVEHPTSDEPVSSTPDNFTSLGEKAIFTANDGVHGREAWVSDATTGGTTLLLDITPGRNGSDLQQFVSVNGVAYFMANSRLWKTDGSTAGTATVTTHSFSGAKLTPVGNTLFFVASSAAGSGLWKSDGTDAGTVLVKPNVHAWRPENFVDVNGTLYFTASDGATGHELWKSDGSAAGTVIVKDILPGAASSGPHLLTNVNGTLFFRASDGAYNYELWKSDGTAAGTALVKDINPGPDGSIIQSLVAMNGVLYFTADDRVHGQEIWRSDGTAAGTYLLKDLYPGAHGSSPGLMTVSNGVMYFRGDDGGAGSELWKSDGTAAGTAMVKDLAPGPGGSAVARIVPVSSGIVFVTTPTTWPEITWRSDGSSEGTFELYPFRTEGSAQVGDSLLTTGWSYGGYELLKIDPTGAAPATSASLTTSMPPPPSSTSEITAPSIVTASPEASSSSTPSSSTAPGVVYDATLPGDKPNLVAAGFAPMRVTYNDVYTTGTDATVADEAAVRRVAREVAAAGQTLVLNIEHWHNDIRYHSESVVGWSAEKMMQVVDWIHDERPEVKVAYAGQVTHGAYPPPARGTSAYNAWHASHERLRPLIDKVDFLSPGVYVIDEYVANWIAYAEAHIAETRLYDKPVIPFLFMDYEGGHNTAHRVIAPEFTRMQLDVMRDIADAVGIWGPWRSGDPWYEITRDFITTPTALIPAAAVNLSADVQQTESRIALAWQDKSHDESGFRIERRDASAGPQTFAPIASVARNVTSWSDESATPGVQYVYRVIAHNAGGDAMPSNEVTAGLRAAPTAPVSVQATALSPTRIRVEWQPSSDDVESFIIERSSGGAAFAPIAWPAADQRSYEDANLQPGTTYAYRVRAVNAVGQSAPSAEASATTPLNDSGLLAHWRFDAKSATTAIDSAGNHDGALAGANGTPAGVTGTLGSALLFDGVDDRVTVADAVELRFAATDSFTLGAWVNLTSLPNSAGAIVAKARGSAAPYGIALDSSNRWIGTGPQPLIGPAAQLGWTHVAVVQDAASNQRRLYVNGGHVATADAQAADGIGALWIGAAEGTSEFFAGKIDDVRLYARAVSAQDVSALANPHVVIPTTTGADVWSVVRNAAGDRMEFYTNNVTDGGPEFSRPADAVGSITFTGGDGDDRLSFDFGNGDVMPLYGTTFTGGAGVDTLAFTGANASDAFTVDAADVRHNLTAVAHTGAEWLELAGGAFDVSANLAAKRLHLRAGASAAFHASQDFAELKIDNATARLTAGGDKVITTSALAILNGGSLDLSDNDMIVRNGSTDAMFTFLTTGAIVSSLAEQSGGMTTLALGPAAAAFGLGAGQTAPFAGRTVSDADVILKYTYAGDANFDGKIDADDYGSIDFNILVPGSSGYWNGDFNYDGVINADDYGSIDFNILAQGAAL